ncbi:MAG: prolyl aminopeptidase [Gammaproteobacteria bacterium]|nr:prolyl aminopeptidase [Gammaproteobacteria bacterium]
MNQRPQLYPSITPFESGFLRVSPRHTIYYEQSGNPAGKPVVFLHGGPGGGSNPRMRQFFNPEVYRIVLMDQRGCGQSLPHACVEDNTTWQLIADLEALRRHLDIDAWQLFGGSWGSTLALAYAERHPQRVTELVLRGIFLLRQKELHWFYQDGAGRLFPDAWQRFLAPIPAAEHHDLLHAYHRRLHGDDRRVQLEAARAWSQWEAATSELVPCGELIEAFGSPAFALAFARIESHYFVHRGFFDDENRLLAGVEHIRHLPATIIHGRYDVICPLETAWELHQAWPEARFVVVPEAGHSAFETGIAQQLVAATDHYGGVA